MLAAVRRLVGMVVAITVAAAGTSAGFGGDSPVLKPVEPLLLESPLAPVEPTLEQDLASITDVMSCAPVTQSPRWQCDCSCTRWRQCDRRCGGCERCGCCGFPFWLRGRSGGDHLSVPGETDWGGLYGFDFGAPLVGNLGLWGSINVSHVSEGTQLAGSGGFLKIASPNAADMLSRINAALLIDQFYDSRFDNGLYLNQLRVLGGFAVTERLHVGAVYSQNLNRDDVLFHISPFNFTDTGSVRLAPTIGGYVTGCVGGVKWTAQAGSRLPVDVATVNAGVRVPLTDRLETFTVAHYEPELGAWATTIGLQFLLTPRRTRGASHGASRYTIRGQNGDESLFPLATTVQLPTFAFQTVTTTVSVPDGGTILLGGSTPGRLSSAIVGKVNNPFLINSKIPYVSRLFRNVGVNRDPQSLMLMVTPRIIIQEEEEE